jgi:glycolate oxidase
MPRPACYRTVLAAYGSLESAGHAVSHIVAAGLLPGAMEIMDRLALQAIEAAVHPDYPPGAAAVLIVELEGDQSQVEEEFNRLMAVLQHSQPDTIRVARDEADRQRIWKGRKSAFSAVGRLSPDYLVQDGVVPRSRLGEALAEIECLSQKYGLRVANVFHAGDGNLHPLILYDGRRTGELSRATRMASEIMDLCIRCGGSITGEHGIGIEKREYLPRMFTAVEIDTFHALHDAIDPLGIANRGKMFPS